MRGRQAGQGALVCIPTYNEREGVELIVQAILGHLPEGNVLVIDDSSPDGTGKLANRLAARDGRVHVLHRTGSRGLGPAYRAGFAWALARDYRHIVECDADFSHDPSYLPEMLDRLAEADVVVGSRRVLGGGVEGWGPFRRFVSSAGSLYSRIILGVPVRDLTGGLNAFRREALVAADFASTRATGFTFQIEIKNRCAQAGLRIVEMPIIFVARRWGESKMNHRQVMEGLGAVWRLRFER